LRSSQSWVYRMFGLPVAHSRFLLENRAVRGTMGLCAPNPAPLAAAGVRGQSTHGFLPVMPLIMRYGRFTLRKWVRYQELEYVGGIIFEVARYLRSCAWDSEFYGQPALRQGATWASLYASREAQVRQLSSQLLHGGCRAPGNARGIDRADPVVIFGPCS
jgi:hypothetical protein